MRKVVHPGCHEADRNLVLWCDAVAHCVVPGAAGRTDRLGVPVGAPPLELTDLQICRIGVPPAVVRHDGAFDGRPVPVGSRPGDGVILICPRTRLPLAMPQLTSLLGVRIPAVEGSGAALLAILTGLTGTTSRGHGCGPRPPTALHANAIVSLVTLLLVEQLHALDGSDDRRPSDPTGGGDDLYRRVCAFIEQRLADPDLSPAVIAAAHHVSLRQLYRVFECRGSTVAAWVRHRRLERCRQELESPANERVPVRTIASRWGFGDVSHFTRAFSAAYGLPPAAYRRDARSGALPAHDIRPAPTV